MCLLVVLSRVVAGTPLVVAANRDERFERPTVPLTVLGDHGPRILGGRDGLAGGTWLAVNEHGVVAGLTNFPSPAGRDASKRSRGELPLALVRHRSAAAAVEDFAARFRTPDYNACWLLVGDRETLFYLDMTTDEVPGIVPLGPGVHVLENSAIDAPTSKTDYVRARLVGAGALPVHELLDYLGSVLADHTVTAPEPPPPADRTTPPRPRPPQLSACCVHTEGYGTRSAALVTVPAEATRPGLRVAEGPPCTAPFVDAERWWSELAPVFPG